MFIKRMSDKISSYGTGIHAFFLFLLRPDFIWASAREWHIVDDGLYISVERWHSMCARYARRKCIFFIYVALVALRFAAAFVVEVPNNIWEWSFSVWMRAHTIVAFLIRNNSHIMSSYQVSTTDCIVWLHSRVARLPFTQWVRASERIFVNLHVSVWPQVGPRDPKSIRRNVTKWN